MGMNFPNSPVYGQNWPSPPIAGLPVYQWDGEKWTAGPPAIPDGVVHYDMYQQLTQVQEEQARRNIAAAPFDAMMYSNLIINGGMDISQENGSTAVGVVSGVNKTTVDMFKVRMLSSVASVQAQQTTTAPPNFRNALAVTASVGLGTPAAGDMITAYTIIEGTRIARLGWGTGYAQPLTIGFFVDPTSPGPLTGTVCVQNVAQNRTCCANFTVQQFTWNFVTVTIPGDTAGTWVTDNTAAMLIWIVMGVGSLNNTAPNGSWTSGGSIGTPQTSNWFSANGYAAYLTGFFAISGSEAPHFLNFAREANLIRPFAEELILCQRYYEKGFPLASYRSVAATGVTVSYDSIPYKVMKRITNPVVTLNGWQYWNTGGGTVSYTPGLQGGNENFFTTNGSGMTNFVGWTSTGTWISDARM